MSQRFTIDARDFQRAGKELEHAGFGERAGTTMGYAIRRSANLVRKNVRAELRPHNKTGKMRDRVRVRIRGRGLETVGGIKTTGVGSNLIVGGVAPHRITSQDGKVMPLYQGKGRGLGITGFARAVEHPGFKGDPFFKRGVDKSVPAINDILRASAATMVRELAFRMKGRR